MPLWGLAGLRLGPLDNSVYREGVPEHGGGLSSPLGTLSPGILTSTGAAALFDMGASVGSVVPPGGLLLLFSCPVVSNSL